LEIEETKGWDSHSFREERAAGMAAAEEGVQAMVVKRRGPKE
jgi:hypothetical protein